MAENKQVATRVKIYDGDEFDPETKGRLVARGVSPKRGFSEKPLELDDEAQTFVTVDGEKVYLNSEEKKVKK